MNMKSIPPTAPAEQVVCGDAADGFQVKLIYPKPESIATRCASVTSISFPFVTCAKVGDCPSKFGILYA